MKTLNEALTDISLEEIDTMSMSARAERLRNRYRVGNEESHALETNIDIVVETGICNIHGEYSQQVKRLNPRHRYYGDRKWVNWQYPTSDRLCVKCRAENAKKRQEMLKKESVQKWLGALSLEQQLAIKTSIAEQKAVDKEKENRRRTNGYDYSYNRAGDK
jgi:hypothetical protein